MVKISFQPQATGLKPEKEAATGEAAAEAAATAAGYGAKAETLLPRDVVSSGCKANLGSRRGGG